MFIEISLISCGVYFGSKLYKKIQGKIQKESDPLKNSLQSQASQAVTNSLPIKNSYTDYEKTINRNMIISAGSIVLTIAGSLFYSPLTLFGCAGVIYVILPIIKRAKDAVFKERRMRIAILDSLAIISALAFGYYVICAFASCIYYIAQKLLLKTEDKAKQSLVNIFGEQPASVWISKNDMEIEIPFEALSAGDITVAGAGEQIPADGVIIGGNASIDQHILTGEAQPVEKGVGDQVFSSTIILSGKIHIQVEKTGQETVAAKIVNVLNKTDDFKSFVQLQGEEIADKSVVPVLAASAFAYPLVGTYGTIALLASDFLDNMRIVAPIGMLNTLLAASQTGLLIKDGRSLELLNQIDTFVFDKTGTLTLEQPSVHNIFSFSEIKEDKILAYAAVAESRQKHPIAKAIIEEAGRHGISYPEPDEASYKLGYGITVKIDGKLIRAGSARFMKMEGIPIPDKAEEVEKKSYEMGYSLVYITVDDQLAGAIELEPTIRPEARQIIESLKRRNMSVCIISGDHKKPTEALAANVGIDDFYAEVLPKNKADIIEELQNQGRKVCFVGDGINDSIALKKANVSISLRGASTVATDTAQIILMDQTLKKIPALLELAEDFQENMKNSFYVVCAPAIFGIGGIFFLHFGLISAVLLYQSSLAAGATHVMLPRIKEKIRKEK